MTPNYVPYLLHIFVRVTYLFLIIMVSGEKNYYFWCKRCYVLFLNVDAATKGQRRALALV